MGTKKTSPLLFVFDAHREGGCGSVGTGPSGRSAAERGIAVGNGSGGIATAGRAGSAAVPGLGAETEMRREWGCRRGIRFVFGRDVSGRTLRPFIRGWGETAGITRSGSRSARIGTVRPGLQANEQAGAARRVQVCAAACVPLTGNRSLRNRRRGSGRTGTGSHPPL